MSNAQQCKTLFEELERQGLIEYGAIIEAVKVRAFLGIEVPEIGTKKVFDQLALAELSAIDYVRNVLLGRGMYLSQHQGDYRIILPSENKRQVDLYMSSADKKLSRALKLSRNSPKSADQPNCQTDARIVMKKNGLRRQIGF